MQTQRVVGGLGRALVGAGALVLLFVAYQLWGTGVTEARSQANLRQELIGKLPGGRLPGGDQQQGPSRPGSAQASAPEAPAAEGRPIGIIQIPKIGVDKVIVQGVGTEDLRQGPGHYTGTPLPGQLGNSAIAGHRTTYGAPFYNLDHLSHGDLILIDTPQGDFHYGVTRSMVVDPSDVSVLAPTQTAQLTLTTCYPRFSASQRLIVRAALESTPAPTPPATDRPPVQPTNLAGEQGTWLPALWWGLGAAAAALFVWLVARRQRRFSSRTGAYLVGGVGVLVVLFFFFAAVSRLLPASI